MFLPLCKSGWVNPRVKCESPTVAGLLRFLTLNSLAVWESNYARAICFGLLWLDGFGA